MNEPTEEQIKKFWEWCGFRQLPIGKRGFHWENAGRVSNWYLPDNENPDNSITHLPRLDLNNLFKYAVPKVPNLTGIDFAGGDDDSFSSWLCRVWYGVWADRGRVQVKQNFYEAEGVTPALALFWAIYEVMEAK